MTRGQRRMHLLAWLILPVGLIGLVLWSVRERPPAPTQSIGVEATP